MSETELSIAGDGVQLEATLTLPRGPARGGLVPLHPAYEPSRHLFLFEHLAELLTHHGIAVLRFDRRPSRDDNDVPFAAQAADALAALACLRGQPGLDGVPLGLWAWSQGAWAAPLAAALSTEVAFLVLIASTGVSRASQMRYGTAEQLRQAGYGGEALAESAKLRRAFEEGLRGRIPLAQVQSMVDRYVDRPWFPLTTIPSTVPATAVWTDMDFDPEPVFERVHCPVLLFYGETDEWTPVEPSIAAWHRAIAVSGNAEVEIERLAGATHGPTFGGRLTVDAISPDYERKLLGWLERVLESMNPGRAT